MKGGNEVLELIARAKLARSPDEKARLEARAAGLIAEAAGREAARIRAFLVSKPGPRINPEIEARRMVNATLSSLRRWRPW